MRLSGKDAPLTKRRKKISVTAHRAEISYMTRNEDGTFDITYVARREVEPAKLEPALAATIPKNGMVYWETIGGIDYPYVFDKKTGESLGYVCECGFRSPFKDYPPCESRKSCKSCSRQKSGKK
jgi:hypothetical protein